MKNLIATQPLWYVHMQVMGSSGAITSSARAALPATAPPRELVGTRHERTSTVMVFEDAADSQKYYSIYYDHSLREGLMLGDHAVHALSPQQVHDTFMIPPKRRKDVMLVPIPVFHEDAQEFLDAFIKAMTPREVGQAVAIITKKNADRTARA